MRQLIRTYEITGLHEITITGYTFTKEDVRLVIDETIAITDKKASILVSSTSKNNIVSVTNEVITLASTTAALGSSDELTIEIDIDNVAKEATVIDSKLDILSAIAEIPEPDLSNVAKQGANPNTSLTVVDGKIDGFYDTFDADIALQLQGIIGDTKESVSGSSQTVTEVERLRTLQESYDALSANNNSVVEFFGITPLQGYEFMTDKEVTDEIEDIMQALDNELTTEQAAAITTEAMQIINTQNS